MKITFIYLLSFVYLVISFSFEKTKFIDIYLFISIGLLCWGLLERKLLIDRRNEEISSATNEMLERIPHTEVTRSSDHLRALLLNEVSKTFIYVQREKVEDEFEKMELRFEKVLEVAIMENDKMVALYPYKNGLLASGKNMYAHELNEEEEEDDDEETIDTLSLKIVVDNISSPIIDYSFIDDEESLTKDTEEYEEAINECRKWYEKLSIIIKRYEKTKSN